MTQDLKADAKPGQQDFPDVELADVIDVPALQEMMDDYYALTGIGVGIIDLKGNVLIGTGWQDICVKFHRAVPESCVFCRQSDTSLSTDVPSGTFKEYRCKNNMWDISTPIMLGDRHIGNIFLGQFLYEDEEPDYELFRAQAKRFGYDETEYLAALDQVPRWSRETVRKAMSFYAKLARMISKAGYNNIILAEALARSERAEEELRFTRISVETASDALFWVDAEGRFVDVNEAACRTLGYSREALLQLRVPDVNPSFNDDTWPDHFAELRQCGTLTFENELTRQDGRVFPVEIVANYVKLNDRELNCSFVRNISERKRVEKKLWLLNHVFYSSIAAKSIAGLDGVITEANDAFLNTWGFHSKDEVVGRPIAYFFNDPDDAADILCALNKTGRWEGEFSAKRGDGSGFIAYGLATQVRDRDGQMIAYQSACMDITEQKRNAAELAQAKEAAEAANQAKSEFLANISHEIRTPITGIMGMAQLLELTELSTDQKQYLEAIQLSSDNLLNLINDLLDLSKIEAGKIELERTAFSLRGSINDLLRTQISQIHAKGLTIRTDIPAGIPDHLTGDQLRLKQILLNLVSNAIKFTDKGGIDISVALEERQHDTALLRFSVADTGIGIKPKVLAKIFEPFTQADTSTTRNFGGTGLGLAICTRLVDLMGGSINVTSTEGVGSTFQVVIPFAVNDLQIERQENKEVLQSLAWEGPPLNILLAEDHEVNRKLFVLLLQQAGHTLETAANGREAVGKWEKNNFDIILMDVQMPETDGIEATRTIREREMETEGHIPIIALTAHALREDQENFLGQGFDGYVSKPLNLTALKEQMRHCLKRKV